jgi:hypothetical protein
MAALIPSDQVRVYPLARLVNKTENIVLKKSNPEIKINPNDFSGSGCTKMILIPIVKKPKIMPIRRDGFK